MAFKPIETYSDGYNFSDQLYTCKDVYNSMKYMQEEHSNNLEYVANYVVKYSCTNASNYSVLYGCTRLLRVPVRVEVKVITTWPEWTLSPVISQTLALSGRR